MKKLYKFFILFICLIAGWNPLVSAAEIVLNSRPSPQKLSIKVNRTFDSIKLHNSLTKDLKNFKTGLVFFPPKTSIYNKYLYSTLGSKSVSFHKIDTAGIPINSNLSGIQVSTPIHDAMTLSYSLIQENVVTAKIFSVLGNEITTLFSERQNPGPQIRTFNISDKVSTGIYILRLTVGSQRIAKRIQVL